MRALHFLLLVVLFHPLSGYCGSPADTGRQSSASAVESYTSSNTSNLWIKASAGNPDAQFTLGQMLWKGDGIKQDKAKGFEWSYIAAKNGNANAQYWIGGNYRYGNLDYGEALEWYRKAAAQGFAAAQSWLGMIYSHGYGVSVDFGKAISWFEKAAAQGYRPGQFSLGMAYEKGEGVTRNDVLAYAWYILAASTEKEDGIAAEQRDIVERRLPPAQRAEGQRLAAGWKKGEILSSSEESRPLNQSSLSKESTGTAFVVSDEGDALTNYHVIRGCTEVRVPGQNGLAKVVRSDSVNDLALLKLPNKADVFASFNPDPGKLRQGEDIIVFGYPLNFVLSSGGNLTPGIISALTGLGNNTNQLQITAPIQPGSSGSPVMDKKGDVVGVVSMMLDDSKMTKATGQVGQNVNFAVNGLTVKAFLDANGVQYKNGGGFFSREKSNADIADAARKWTLVVECWK